MNTNKLYISWEQAIKDTQLLLGQLKSKLGNQSLSRVKLIIPCRGGEIIGSLIKNGLGLSEKQVHRIKFSNLKYEQGVDQVAIKDKFDYNNFLNLLQQDEKDTIWIFLDDLVDSGLTIDYLKKYICTGQLIVGVLYSKLGKNKNKTDICIQDLEDKWLVFPWEDFYEK